MSDSTFNSPFTPLTVALYAPSSAVDVHTDTTITLEYPWNNYKNLVLFFLATSSTSSTRSLLLVSTQAIGQGGWYAISQGATIGGVRITYPSGDYGKLRFVETSLSSLYIYRVWGTN